MQGKICSDCRDEKPHSLEEVPLFHAVARYIVRPQSSKNVRLNRTKKKNKIRMPVVTVRFVKRLYKTHTHVRFCLWRLLLAFE